MKEKIYERGITLIALVITIIVLLILAGVTLSIVFNGGIINKSQTAVEAYDEGSARESLQIELVALMAEKVTNKDYNKDTFLNNKIANAGFTISGDMVIVDGYKFIIDRDKLQIVSSLGKGVENNNIGIILSQNISTDYIKSIVSITVTSDKALDYIEVNGTKITDYTENNGTYTLNDIEVTENKTVSVLVQDIDKGYKINSIPVSELTEDMNIYTKADLIAFGQKVNEGRTFENRKVCLKNSINLNENSVFSFDYENGTFSYTGETPENWVVIGDATNVFKGTFDGEYNTIYNLYLNSNEYQNAGLFGVNKGNIENLFLENVYINNNITIESSTYTGGIVGINYGEIIRVATKNGSINSYNAINSSSSNIYVVYAGGIAGINENGSSIKESYNKAKVYGKTLYQKSKGIEVGGITGLNNGEIMNVYNAGDIKGYSYYTYLGGVISFLGNGGTISNSYNISSLTNEMGNTAKIGGILSRNGWSNATRGTIGNNLYCLIDKCNYSYYYYNNTGYSTSINGRISSDELMKKTSTLGNAFIDDVQVNGNWIYNNGYPILKWQKEHNVVNK